MELVLSCLDDTAILAAALVSCIQKMDQFPALLLEGDLGSGKTTMTGKMVRLLPGGQEAEVSSPSFNIMNIYPTVPETVHFDFYRMEGLGLDGTMEDYLYDPERFSIVEWINYLPKPLWPDEYLLMQWSIKDQTRKITLTPGGILGKAFLECLTASIDPGLCRI